jgi:hypothetical protein
MQYHTHTINKTQEQVFIQFIDYIKSLTGGWTSLTSPVEVYSEYIAVVTSNVACSRKNLLVCTTKDPLASSPQQNTQGLCPRFTGVEMLLHPPSECNRSG